MLVDNAMHGLVFPQEQNEIIEATGLTKKKVISILNALISNQLDSLEKMIETK